PDDPARAARSLSCRQSGHRFRALHEGNCRAWSAERADIDGGEIVVGAALLDLPADRLARRGRGRGGHRGGELVQTHLLVDAVRDDEPGPAGTRGEPGHIRLTAAADGALKAVRARAVRDLVQRDLAGFPPGERGSVVARL